jgi:RHS repeat-associated protein
VEDQTKSESFTYDAWRRLAQAQTLNQTSSGTWNLQWSYDRLGNRLSQGGTGNGVTIGQPNFTIDAGTNRIVGYCYDAAGNLTDEGGCPAAGSPHRYTFDGTNRLITVNNGTATASYTYMGPLRIKKVTGGTTTVYIYSGTKPIAEYVGGQLSKEYIYSGSRMLATIAGAAITYHHPDHLSSRAETDATGTATRTFGSFPYGETWYETGTIDKWKFTSYERDTAAGETGLDYAVFRQYSSGEARYTTADLVNGNAFIPQSLNRFSYVANDPVNLIDPLGLCGEPDDVDSSTNTITGHAPCIEPIIENGIGGLALEPFQDGPSRKPCPKKAGWHWLPHTIGALFNATLELGAGSAGATATGSAGSAYSISDSGQLSGGAFLSGGASLFAGSHSLSAPTQSMVTPFALGGYAGAGMGVFVSNAQSPMQLAGPFAQWNANVGFGPGYSVSFSYDNASGTWVLSITQGPGAGISGSALTTTTNARATGAACE